MDYEERKAYRKWLISTLDTFDFTHAVTLIFNDRGTTVDMARRRLKEFHGRVDAKLLGHGWAKKDDDCRTFFGGFFEHVGSNLHVHLIVQPAQSTKVSFEEVAGPCWTALAPRGDVCIKPLDDKRGWLRYITKEIEIYGVTDQWLLSSEFHAA